MTESAKRLELDKILAQAGQFCVLEASRRLLLSAEPTANLQEAGRLLALTAEALPLTLRLPRCFVGWVCR